MESYGGIASATIQIAPAKVTTPAVLRDQLVATGYLNGNWVTRRSLDAGATWETARFELRHEWCVGT